MKISISQSDDVIRKVYTLVLKNESTTININLGPLDLTEKIEKLVAKAKEGIADQVMGIAMIPAGNSVIIKIICGGLTYSSVCALTELEFE